MDPPPNCIGIPPKISKFKYKHIAKLNDNVLDLYLELKQTKTDTIIDLCSKINEQAF
jgi:hypothetical protein